MTNPSVPFIAQSFKAGDKLAGCYTLKEVLPSQGFCFVWLANDEELNKDIVLHFVPDFVAADGRAMSELKQEAKRNRQLIHPRIIRVHDLVADENWAAISMDYVPGETLAALQKKREKNAYNPSEIASAISELWQTIEDAHRIDLFHRDLTPENIVATGNGVMVEKFGISRVILDSLARGGQQIEASRDIAYLSPQQLDGERPSRADDIYSLGASIFDLLTGTPPFSEGDVIPQIRKTVPPLVSERRSALGITGEPVPKGWEDAIAACLAKTVEERPRSAGEAGARFAATKPGAASPASSAAATGATVATAAAAAGAAAVAEAAAAELPAETKEAPAQTPPPEQEAAAKQQKRPWTPGPGKTPVIAEATILSKTPVPKMDKGEGKGEAPKETPPAKPPEPLAAAGAGGGAKKGGPGGPTTPTGFPLRAFVGVEAEQKRPKGKSSAGLIALGVVLALILVIGYIVARNNGGPSGQPESSLASTGTNGETSGATTSESTTPPTPVEAASAAPAPVNLASTTTTSPSPVAAEATPSAAPSASESPAPAPMASATPIPAAALAAMTDAQAQQLLADKTKAVDKAKAALADAEKAALDKAAAQTQAAAAVQELQASVKQKADAAAAAKKAADAAAAALKQQQESLQKAQADADAAQKEAAAKAQAADELRKTVQAAEAAAQQQQAAQQQAQADADQLAKAVADRRQAADAAAKAAADAEKARQQQAQALSQAQADLGQTQTSVAQAHNAEKARQAAEEAARIQKQREAAAAQAAAQVAAATKAAADAQAALAAAQKAVADAQRAQAEAQRQAEAAQNGTLPSPAGSPAPAATPSGEATPAATPSGAVPPPTGAAASPAPGQGTPTLSVRAPNPHLKVDQALSNSLGMRFAPVGKVFFSVWLTRVQDFTAFAKATGYKGTAWLDPGFKQAPDHPVVNVSWNDANQFCLWLTEKEHHDGILAANQTYRLPTDLEWSAAVGLPPETGRTPESRDMDVPDVYPWGTEWPPPAGAGNYTGEETDSDVAIKGYNDGFAWTSPVASFNANKFGLYDMGGNVWEWCEDWWNSEQKAKVLRGGSWYNGALKLSLLSSCRIHASADQGTDNYGFRVVIAEEMKKPKHHAP